MRDRKMQDQKMWKQNYMYFVSGFGNAKLLSVMNITVKDN